MERDALVAEVRDAWRCLVDFNPNARTLGGAHSRRLWAALDALVDDDVRTREKADGGGQADAALADTSPTHPLAESDWSDDSALTEFILAWHDESRQEGQQ